MNPVIPKNGYKAGLVSNGRTVDISAIIAHIRLQIVHPFHYHPIQFARYERRLAGYNSLGLNDDRSW